MASIDRINIEHITVYRDVKYPRLEYKTGNLLLVLPKNYKNKDEFLSRHRGWIEKKKFAIMSALRESDSKTLNKMKEKELEEHVRKKAKEFSKHLHTEVKRITFIQMKTKWGSCSRKRTMMVNKLMRYLPTHLIDYVIFHELAHTVERRHNERFWRIIETKYPDHQRIERDLFTYWFLIRRSSKKRKN